MPLPLDELRAIIDKYRWEPGERETAMDAVAERQQQNAAAELEQPVQPAKAEPMMITKQHAMAAPAQTQTAEYWDNWRSFVRNTMRADIRKSEVLVSDCVGKVLGQVDKRHAEALDEVRAELAALKTEVAELRGELKTRAALADMEARLMRMETAPTLGRLKAAG